MLFIKASFALCFLMSLALFIALLVAGGLLADALPWPGI